MNTFIKKILKQTPFVKKRVMEYIDLKKEVNDLRLFTAYRYIKGNGIEIGALHRPQSYKSSTANLKYVDRMSRRELEEHYPELNEYKLVDVDIIDDGEVLNSIPDNSLDFIIANHYIEHCLNPIKTIQNHMNKLKAGGILYYTIPDKRYDIEKERDLTTFQHLGDDYFDKNDHSIHFQEWSRYALKITDEAEIKSKAEELIQYKASIHFHTWTANSFFDFISKVNLFNRTDTLFAVEFFAKSGPEVIVILKKE